jgi:hypothetical protein
VLEPGWEGAESIVGESKLPQTLESQCLSTCTSKKSVSRGPCIKSVYRRLLRMCCRGEADHEAQRPR